MTEQPRELDFGADGMFVIALGAAAMSGGIVGLVIGASIMWLAS